MLHPKYIEELKSAPIDKVDFVATFQEVRPTWWGTLARGILT